MGKNYQMQLCKDGFLGIFWISQDAGRFLFLVVVYSLYFVVALLLSLSKLLWVDLWLLMHWSHPQIYHKAHSNKVNIIINSYICILAGEDAVKDDVKDAVEDAVKDAVKDANDDKRDREYDQPLIILYHF